MKNPIIMTIVVALVVGGGAFFAGMKYQQSKLPQGFRQFNGGQNMMLVGQNNGNRANFRPVNGEIINTDDKSITVKLADGSSKIVLLSDKTEINEATQAAKTDLTTGKKVMVLGQENSDGSVTASNIQLNPVLRNAIRPQ